jgi:predicted phosphodiesterase
MLEQPLVVVGDVHFSHAGPPDTGPALARLIEGNAGAEVVLNGDVWNLSLDAPAREPHESLLGMLATETELRAALRKHLSGQGRVTILPGNHDAAVGSPGLRERLLAWLELSPAAALTLAPWFLRHGTVHVEHGHAYDPDNAPTHPLVAPTIDTEPLGVALTRRFLAPNNAFDFAHATEITPVEALVRAWRAFGLKMPLVLARYFSTAGNFCREAGWRPELAREQERGDAALAALVPGLGLDRDTVQRLLEDRPRPTHESVERAFFRLYFDRVVATLGTAGGVGAGIALRSAGPFGLAALSALYLIESTRRGTNRYEGLPVKRLREAAGHVQSITGAHTVIFGHTHVPDTKDGYLNPGSFKYRQGDPRPYAYVDLTGHAERRLLP